MNQASSIKFVHTGDLHFSNKTEKRAETVTTTDALLDTLGFLTAEESPDVAFIAGDTVDEMDGAIRLDSATARETISFVRRLADHCPIVIIRGTPSHDRNTPEILREVRSTHPIYVGTEIEQVALTRSPVDGIFRWQPLTDLDDLGIREVCGLFTLIPSVDKARLYAARDASMAEGNALIREALHDVFAGMGEVNKQFSCPKIGVAHGMVTGATFSTGQTAVGDDLEFGVHDLKMLGCDYVALGHDHMHQFFGPRMAYSGSTGRLNFGEVEEKGFITGGIDGSSLTTTFHKLPAREFSFAAHEWSGSVQDLFAAVQELKGRCQGTDTRFRYSIPQEEAGAVSRAGIEAELLSAGANVVKVECSIIPKVRQRAEGISRITDLRGKAAAYGKSIGEELIEDDLALVDDLQSKTVEELAAEALERIGGEDLDEETDSFQLALRAAVAAGPGFDLLGIMVQTDSSVVQETPHDSPLGIPYKEKVDV